MTGVLLTLKSKELILRQSKKESKISKFLCQQVDGAIEKRFGKKEVLVPIQLVLRRNPSPDPRFQPDAAAAELAGREMEPGGPAIWKAQASLESLGCECMNCVGG